VEAVTLEEVVAQLKRDPAHPVRTKIDDLTIEVRAFVEPAPNRTAAHVFAEIVPWEGETTEEILKILGRSRTCMPRTGCTRLTRQARSRR
jgi:hypothetical protein